MIEQPESAPLTLYFSLPFYPVKNKNFFYHGHLALGVDDRVYQIYNPLLLESDFLVSIMPRSTWLHTDTSDFWVDRDSSSPTWRHVYLYKAGELSRTTVYYISLTGIAGEVAMRVGNYFSSIEDQFSQGKLHFNFLTRNCSNLLMTVFHQQYGIAKSITDIVPSLLFRRIHRELTGLGVEMNVGKLKKNDNPKFRVHRYCIGINSLHSEMYMDRWIMMHR